MEDRKRIHLASIDELRAIDDDGDAVVELVLDVTDLIRRRRQSLSGESRVPPQY